MFICSYDRVCCEGDQAPGTEPGDIVIVVDEKEHSRFKRVGHDLLYRLEISLSEALCGFRRLIQTLDGRHLDILTLPGLLPPPSSLLTAYCCLLCALLCIQSLSGLFASACFQVICHFLSLQQPSFPVYLHLFQFTVFLFPQNMLIILLRNRRNYVSVFKSLKFGYITLRIYRDRFIESKHLEIYFREYIVSWIKENSHWSREF